MLELAESCDDYRAVGGDDISEHEVIFDVTCPSMIRTIAHNTQ